MATILETLSPDDLERWRQLTARFDAYGSPALSLGSSTQNAEEFYLSYYRLVEHFLDKYGIEGEERVECKISPYHGHIYIGEGE